jgi:hypothetical protein
MSSKSKTAGDTVDARCTKCRLVTNHTIIAMVGAEIVRVQCNTCGGSHKYHPPKAEPVSSSTPSKAARPAAKPPTSSRKARAEEASDFQEWAARCRREGDIRSRPYDIDGAFRSDEVIAHPSFGLGIVKTTIRPNKMEVLFEGGRKLLRCRL